MGRTREEILEIVREAHNEKLKKLPSQEKLLEVIHEEELLSETLTVSETEDGLEAWDHAGAMLLRLMQKDDGSAELAWAEESRPIGRREVFDVPSEAYLEFLYFLEGAKDRFEREKAEASRHGKKLKALLKRWFG